MAVRPRFEHLVLLSAAAFLVVLLARYDVCFQDSEVLYLDRAAVENGTGFSGRDLRTSLNVMKMEGDVRPRFISYLTFILALKTRLALWEFVPPHPSFSPVWLVTLLVGPLLLFRFLLLEIEDRAAAWAGVSVLLVSTGFVSGLTMLFHPAKPLALVHVLAVLYLSARLGREPGAPPALRRALMALLVVAPYVDETAVFAYAIPLLWCPTLPWRTYLVPVGITAALLLAILPAFPDLTGAAGFSVPDYMLRMARDGMDRGWRLDLRHLAWNVGNLLIPPLLPWQLARAAVPLEEHARLPATGLALLALAGVAATRVARRNAACWRPYRRLVVLAAGFIVFHTLVLVFHPYQLVATGFYYGASFSALFAALAAVVYSALRRSPKLAPLAAWGLVWVVAISALNFTTINASWMRHSNTKTITGMTGFPGYHAAGDWSAFDAREAEMAQAPQSVTNWYTSDESGRTPREERAAVTEMWQARRAGRVDFVGSRPLTHRDLWMYVELRLPADAGQRR